MSKNVESENLPKNIQRDLDKLTERQKYSYILKMSLNQTNINNREEEDLEDQILDYDKYFREQQKKRIEAMDKTKVLERNKLISKSQKEFKPLKKNIYMNRKKYILKDEDAYICECVRPQVKKGKNILTMTENELFGCGERCSNQLISWDCVAHLCPCKESCRNRRFQLQQHAYVFPVKTENRGWGLCAGEFLPKGTFVMQYIGEIYNIMSSYGKKKLEEYKNKNCTYLMSLSDNEVIDPTYKGNLARFINHSCDPNCLTQKWYVLGEQCIGIFTLRDINEGEELTFNYNFDIYKTTFQKCLCGSVNCRGYLGVAKSEHVDRISNSYCRFCKNNVKASDKIIACEGCNKIFHFNCSKKSKFNMIVSSHKANINAIESTNGNAELVGFFKSIFNIDINNVQLQHQFICNSCIKNKLKKDKKNNTIPIAISSSAALKPVFNMTSSIRVSTNNNDQIVHSNKMNNIKANVLNTILNNSSTKKNIKIIDDLDNENDEMKIDNNLANTEDNLEKSKFSNLNDKNMDIEENENINDNLSFNLNANQASKYSRYIYNLKQKSNSNLVIADCSNAKNTLIRMNLEEIIEAGEICENKPEYTNNSGKCLEAAENKELKINNKNTNLHKDILNKNDASLEVGEIAEYEMIEGKDNIDIKNEISTLKQKLVKNNQTREKIDTEKANFNLNADFMYRSKSEVFYKNTNFGNSNIKNFFNENNQKQKNTNIEYSLSSEIKSQNNASEENTDSNRIIIIEEKKREDFSSKSELGEFNCIRDNKGLINPTTEDFFKSDDDEDDEDDNSIIDESIEIDSKNLKIIRANLNMLSTIGARLFWDFRLTSQPKVDIKITGTKTQISKIKLEINKIISSGSINRGEVSETFYVPKIYVRRIIGHQSRNLGTFKSKYNVEIDYDSSLITDEIFSLTELTKLTIRGPEQNFKKVSLEIQNYLYNMKMVSIHLMNTDYSYVKQSICNLKTSIDPADVRLRKKDHKSDREIKHSFYYIPSNSRDLVIIGFDSEVKKGQRIIRDFLLRQNTLENNQSLCFLCPTYLMNTISNFKNEYSELLRSKNVHFKIIEPNYIRKHLNINLEGKWKDIMIVKNYLFRCFSDFYNSSAFLSFNTSHLASINFIPNKKKSSIYDFLQYTYNQEHKLISKNLRKYFIEKNYLIKNWDYISEDLLLYDKYVSESRNTLCLPSSLGSSAQIKKEDFNSSMNLNIFNPNNNFNNTPNTSNSNNFKENHEKEDESNNNQLKTFLKTYDRDTALNYMLNLFPGAYQKYFGMTQIDLCDHLIFYLEEANNSYNHYRKDELEKFNNSNSLVNNSANNTINHCSRVSDKEFKNEDSKRQINDTSDLLISEYEQSQTAKEYKKSSSRKRRRSRSFSRSNTNREKEYYRDREYREREYKDRDFKERDYRDKEYKDKEYKDKEYRDKDTKDRENKEKENKEKENKEKIQKEKEIKDKSQIYLEFESQFWKAEKNNNNDSSIFFMNNSNRFDPPMAKYDIREDKLSNINSVASDNFNITKTQINENDQLNTNTKYSLIKKNLDKQVEEIISPMEYSKENNNLNNQEQIQNLEINPSIEPNTSDDLTSNIKINSKSFEFKNLNILPLNINSIPKSKSFVINNIKMNNEEENIEIKNCFTSSSNSINNNNNKIAGAELNIGNLNTIDISMEDANLNENFINKISEINNSSIKGIGNISNIGNIGTLSNINIKNSDSSENNQYNINNINNDNNNNNSLNCSVFKNNVANSGSSAEKDSICNENFINQASNNSYPTNNLVSANANDMMNILYNFSNINQMNINININSNYKDLLQKTAADGEKLHSNKEYDFLKNIEGYNIMKVFNTNFINNHSINTNSNFLNPNSMNGNELNLKSETIENEIMLLKKKIKSSDYNNNSSKREGYQAINNSITDKKFIINSNNYHNSGTVNLDSNNLNSSDKTKIRQSTSNYNSFENSSKIHDSLISQRKTDSNFISLPSSTQNKIPSSSNITNSLKYDKHSDKYAERVSEKYQDGSKYSGERYQDKYDYYYNSKLHGNNNNKNFNSSNYSNNNSYNNNTYSIGNYNLKSKRTLKSLYASKRRRSSSSRSKDYAESNSPDKYNQNIKQNFIRKASVTSDSQSDSDNISSKNKDKNRENSMGNYVYKRMKIKMRKNAKKERNREKIGSLSSSPNMSLNEEASRSNSKKSNKSSTKFNYDSYQRVNYKPNKKSDRYSKEVSNNSSSGNIQNKQDKTNLKGQSKIEEFLFDIKSSSNKNINSSKDDNLPKASGKYSSKIDNKKRKHSISKSPNSKSRSKSKNFSNSSSRSFSNGKDNFDYNLSNKKIQSSGNFTSQSNNNLGNISSFNVYEKRNKMFGNPNSVNNNSNENQNSAGLKSSNSSNSYLRKNDKNEYLSKSHYFQYSSRNHNIPYSRRYEGHEKDEKSQRKNYQNPKYGHNKFRTRYDYSYRRSYRRMRSSDDDSDKSLDNISENNELLKEFLTIKKSKDLNLNSIDHKNTNFNNDNAYTEEISNDGVNIFNNFNQAFLSVNIVNPLMDVEQPVQIFSSLKKPNFN